MEQQIEAIDVEIENHIKAIKDEWYFEARDRMRSAQQYQEEDGGFDYRFWRERADDILWPMLTHGRYDI